MAKSLDTLMAKAQKGDQDAYRTLLQTAAQKIRAYVGKRLNNESDVEDVTQIVLMALHQNRHTYNPQQAFENWLFGIARYKVMDFLRQNYKERDILSFDSEKIETFSGESPNNNREVILDLQTLLQHLPKKQRDILYRLKIKGDSVADVAVQTGLSPSNVKVIAHRALQQIKGIAESHG